MNPEFQRYLYLDFSVARLIGMPSFLLIVFALTFLIDDKSFSEATANTAIGLYVAIVLFWGAKQSSESIYDEIRNNTWDLQKTSALSPWSLTWGKLFGSTLFNWYGGLLCLIMYTLASSDSDYLTLTWLYALSSGLLAQAVSLQISLFALRRKQALNSGVNYLFALCALFFIMPLMFEIDEFFTVSVIWYRDSYNQAYFNLLALVVCCAWVIVGIYRLLSEELRIRSLPIAWVSFIAFSTFYISGFVLYEQPEQRGWLLIALMVEFALCVSLNYLLLFVDSNNPMQFRKLALYFQQQQWDRFAQELPCWLINVVLALPAMIILTALLPVEKMDEIYFYPLVIFLLLLRDMGILLFFSYAANPKRAISLTVLYLVCLYGLLPSIFLALDVDAIAAVILPLLNTNMSLAIVYAAIQVSFIGFLLFQRWQNRVTVSN